MDKYKLIFTSFVVSIVTIFFVAWYIGQNRIPAFRAISPDSGKLNIVTSIYPLAYAATLVGGDYVSVVDLTPAGAEPHDFTPSPHDLVHIGTADLFLYNGGGFEPWVEKWKQSAFDQPRKSIAMVPALEEYGETLLRSNGIVDPHIWLAPDMMEEEVEIIRNELSVLDPAHSLFFAENADRAIKLLNKLDEDFREGLAFCEKRDVIVSHKAFEYLAEAYNLSITSISGISPDQEPSPKDLARITSLAKEKGVKYIFFETTVSPKLSEAIAREIGGGTLALNPIESLSPSEVELGEDYLSVMQKNLNNLRNALSCQ